MNKNTLFGIPLFLAFVFLLTPVYAQDFYADFEHRGYVLLENGLAVFPQNRKNNAVYSADNTQLFAVSDNTVIKSAHIYKKALLLVEDIDTDKDKLSVHYLNDNPPQEADKAIVENEAVIFREGDTRRVFFVAGSDKIESFQVPLRSAAGFAFSNRKAAYYYIKEIVSNDLNQTQYILSIQVMDLDSATRQTVKNNLQQSGTNLTLSWQAPDRLEVTKSNGQTEIITISG